MSWRSDKCSLKLLRTSRILKPLLLVVPFGNLDELQEKYGRGRWRKLKGVANVELFNGTIRLAEIHWYEAHGIGRRRLKIKRFLD